MFIFNLILMSIRWLYIGLVNHTGPTVVWLDYSFLHQSLLNV
jgi:hypothetical protein